MGVSLRNLRAVTSEAVPIINRHTDELGQAQRDVRVMAQRLKAVDALVEAHLSLTFLGRLRWLLKGR